MIYPYVKPDHSGSKQSYQTAMIIRLDQWDLKYVICSKPYILTIECLTPPDHDWKARNLDGGSAPFVKDEVLNNRMLEELIALVYTRQETRPVQTSTNRSCTTKDVVSKAFWDTFWMYKNVYLCYFI